MKYICFHILQLTNSIPNNTVCLKCTLHDMFRFLLCVSPINRKFSYIISYHLFYVHISLFYWTHFVKSHSRVQCCIKWFIIISEVSFNEFIYVFTFQLYGPLHMLSNIIVIHRILYMILFSCYVMLYFVPFYSMKSACILYGFIVQTTYYSFWHIVSNGITILYSIKLYWM